jgi:hypothetical protein
VDIVRLGYKAMWTCRQRSTYSLVNAGFSNTLVTTYKSTRLYKAEENGHFHGRDIKSQNTVQVLEVNISLQIHLEPTKSYVGPSWSHSVV